MPARDLEWQCHSIGMLDNFVGSRDSALPQSRPAPQNYMLLMFALLDHYLG